MRRQYITRAADIYGDPDAENYVARVIHEQYEERKTGILNAKGDPITLRLTMGPIGFVHFKE